MYKQRTLLAVISLIGVISVFFPWIHAVGGLVSQIGITGPFGVAVLFLTGGSLVMSLKGNRQEPIENPLVFISLGALTAIVCAIQIIMIINSDANSYIGVQPGIALYLSLLAGVFIALAPKLVK